MPWNRTDPEKERMAVVVAYQQEQDSMTVLCRAFGVSRPTLAEVRPVFAEAFQEY